MPGSQLKRVTDYCFARLENEISVAPYIMLPVGSLEPLSGFPLGAVNRLNDTLCEALCTKNDVFLAPSFTYGYSTPFISFAGCSGLHTATIERSLYDCCRGWFFNGFKRIIIMTCSMNGAVSILPAVNRLNQHPKVKNSVQLFSLQDDIFFRTLCEKTSGVKEIGRSEWGLQAMMEYLNIMPVEPDTEKQSLSVPDVSQFKRWNKCGRDPEKLKKMAPGALFNQPHSSASSVGCEIYTAVTEYLHTKIAAFLTEGAHAA